MGDKNAILCGGQRKHIRIADPFQLCSGCRKEVDRWLAPDATRDNGVMKAGVRQEADHVSYRE